jgi:urease accessory protein
VRLGGDISLLSTMASEDVCKFTGNLSGGNPAAASHSHSHDHGSGSHTHSHDPSVEHGHTHEHLEHAGNLEPAWLR